MNNYIDTIELSYGIRTMKNHIPVNKYLVTNLEKKIVEVHMYIHCVDYEKRLAHS